MVGLVDHCPILEHYHPMKITQQLAGKKPKVVYEGEDPNLIAAEAPGRQKAARSEAIAKPKKPRTIKRRIPRSDADG